MSDTLQEELRDLACEWVECCGDIHLPLAKAADRIEAQAAAIDAALAELDASLFTNAEHQRAKDILRAAREDTK